MKLEFQRGFQCGHNLKKSTIVMSKGVAKSWVTIQIQWVVEGNDCSGRRNEGSIPEFGRFK